MLVLQFSCYTNVYITKVVFCMVGLKVQWPELKGVSAVDAKKIIEQDNQYVTAWIYPETQKFVTINCCNRVILFTPTNDCPNGPVLNSPFVG